MSRSITLIARRFSQFSISGGIHGFRGSTLPVSFVPSLRVERTSQDQDLCDGPGSIRHPSAYELPALDNARRVYTFPTFHRAPVVVPAPFFGETVEKMDPVTDKVPMEAPPQTTPISIQLAPRLLIIRRKKMKKHKRRKRYDRDFFKYQKYHREKKLRAEREFVRRMKAYLAELHSFDPEKYVEETIAAAKKEWSDELAPTGRKLYPHWSRLMSLEELYGLPKSDYIDKKAGYPSEEDMEKIKQLRIEYENKFRGV